MNISLKSCKDGHMKLYEQNSKICAGVPNNREALWTSGYSTDAPLYSYISKLNMLRQHAISAESSYLTYNNYPIYSDTTTIAMRKGENNPLIMVLSNKGSEGASYNQTISGTGYSDGDNVLEIVGCTSQTANTNGTLTISMGAGAPKVKGVLHLMFNAANHVHRFSIRLPR